MSVFTANIKTKKYHYSSCFVVKRMNKENMKQLEDSLNDSNTIITLEEYEPCIFCNPNCNQTILDSHQKER